MSLSPSNNPYGNTELVDRLIGTAYDVVRLVSENVLYVKHVSLNMENVVIANNNIAVITAVSQQIDKVVSVADNMAAITSINQKELELQTLYNQLALLTALAASIPAIQNVSNNMSSVNTVAGNSANINTVAANVNDIHSVVANMTTISQIVTLTPQLDAIIANKDAIISAGNTAVSSAAAAQSSATAASISATQAEAARAAAQAIKDGLLADITADATILAPGVAATAVYNPTNKKISFGIPKGNTGDTGPANALKIGTVAGGASAAATITGAYPDQALNLTLPKGDTGEKGWSMVTAIVADSARRVLQVVDWVGGVGTKPVTGQFIGPTGLVATAALATDLRGPAGAGIGDMLISVYDPSGKNGSAFAMDNMSEGTNTKIMTATERTKLASIATGASATAAGLAFTSYGNLASTTTQAAIQELDDEKVKKSGDLMTGELGTTSVQVRGAAGTNRLVTYTSNGSLRWIMGVGNAAEAGSNAGSDFFINRYNDAGTAIDTVLNVNRATGVTSLKGLTLSTPLSGGSVSVSPVGGVQSSTVQAAIQELDTEKANLTSPTFMGFVSFTGQDDTAYRNYLRFAPTNYGVGHGFGFIDNPSPNQWSFGVYDGANNGDKRLVLQADKVTAGTDFIVGRRISIGAEPATNVAALNIIAGNSTTGIDYLQLRPTDWGVGKPYMYWNKTGTANHWQWGLHDGVNSAGQIDVDVATFHVTANLTADNIISAKNGLNLDNVSGSYRMVTVQTGGSYRWAFGGSPDPETGGDVGTDYFINRYNDAGAYQETALRIARKTGIFTTAQSPIGNNSTSLTAMGVTDLNGFGQTGFFSGSSLINTPFVTTDWWYIEQINLYGDSGNYRLQRATLAYPRSGVTNGAVAASWIRRLSVGFWGAWQPEGGWITPEHYGAEGFGNADDTVQVQSALRQGSPVLLSRRYKITSGLTFGNGYGGAQHSIVQGKGSAHIIATMTSGDALTWQGAVPSSFNDGAWSAIIKDVGIVTTTANGSAGIVCTVPGGSGATSKTIELENNFVEGVNGATGFNSGIYINNCTNSRIVGNTVRGRSDNAAGSRNGNGIILVGDGNPVDTQVRDNHVYFYNSAIAVRGTWEGVLINSNIVVACDVGADIQSDENPISGNNDGKPLFVVSDNHFNCRNYGILSFRARDFRYQGNHMYAEVANTTWNGIRVQLGGLASGYGHIKDNTFTDPAGKSSTGATYGVNIDGVVSGGTMAMLVDSNIFVSVAGGVNGGTNATGIKVGSNNSIFANVTAPTAGVGITTY